MDNETSLIKDILSKNNFTARDIVSLLNVEGEDEKLLLETSRKVKQQYVQDKVYFRGLIEFSNICRKDCLYCGIRSSNTNLSRYSLKDEEILEAALYAYNKKFGSIVIQSGENTSKSFVDRIERLLQEINELTHNQLRITLSLGEQSRETYRRWMAAGAQRYLLRIETSNPELYRKLHPDNELHSYNTRIECLSNLKDLGYQMGTGVMIGLPFQTKTDLANDLLFMQKFEIDMVGMGPYIEHIDTPLYQYRDKLLPLEERLRLSFKMIAILRIMMKDINIASTTALQAIDKLGREKALKIGANVIMPNITPGLYRNNYKLYDNKPCTDENADDCVSCMEVRVSLANGEIAWGEWGDSKHYKAKDI